MPQTARTLPSSSLSPPPPWRVSPWATPRPQARRRSPRSTSPRTTVTPGPGRPCGWTRPSCWPAAPAARAARDYLQQIRQVDVGRLTGERRDPAKLGGLMASLGRNVASEVALTVLAADAGGADGPLSRHTVYDYLDVLERLMILEDQPAWAPHMRSKAILRSAAKRHFIDPSLAAAALGATPDHGDRLRVRPRRRDRRDPIRSGTETLRRCEHRRWMNPYHEDRPEAW